MPATFWPFIGRDAALKGHSLAHSHLESAKKLTNDEILMSSRALNKELEVLMPITAVHVLRRRIEFICLALPLLRP